MLFPLLLLTAHLTGAVEVAIGCQREGDIAFTYDQGPSMYTGKLLSTLQKQKVKAAFHVQPDYLDNPILLAYLKKAATDGHLIGLAVKVSSEEDKQDDKQLMARIESNRAIIKKHINYAPTYLRFPSDSPPSPSLLTLLTGKGMTVTGYNLDSQDYLFVNDTSTDAKTGAVYSVVRGVLAAIEPPAKGAFIVVQRDLVGPSVTQSEAIIEEAKGCGYRVVRLDECVGGVVKGGSVGDEDDGKRVKGVSDETSAGWRLRPAWSVLCIIVSFVLVVW